ncbi:MAG: hypothetical protein AB7C90_00160 [Bacteroidales bacterium]
MKRSSKIILLLTALWLLAVSVYSISQLNQSFLNRVHTKHSSTSVDSITQPAPVLQRD